jgi:hypothetical protein
MTKIQIKKYYKIFGIMNLILGIIFIIIYKEIELTERIIGAIAINAVYHMLYLFFSSMYESSYSTRMKNNFPATASAMSLS